MACFIKTETEGYEILDGEVAKSSINAIAKYLGYNPLQIFTIHSFEDKSGLSTVALKVFTKDVLFVITDDESVNVTKSIVQDFVKRNSFDPLYNSLDVEQILIDAVEEKAFNYKFISEVFNVDIFDVDGEVFVPKYDLYLMFVNGILVSFRFSNELNKWAKHLKELNINLFRGYTYEAKYYRGDDIDGIILEVNSQADAFSKTPNAFSNEFIEDHKTEFGNIDFVELLMVNYDAKIAEDDFKELYVGRCRLLGIQNRVHIYEKRNYDFHFDKFKGLVFINKK